MLRVKRSLEETKAGLRFKSPKTKHGRRTISLPASAVKSLREHRIKQMELLLALGLGRLDPDALVFSERRRACVALGIPRVTFHALRHTHASALIAAGLDIVTISRRLGHANPTVTLNTYAHLFSKSDTLAAAAIEAAMGTGEGNGQGVKK